MIQFSTRIEEADVVDELLFGTDEIHKIICWNDDVNTFDWVIESLISVCKHTQEQAAQCALIVHTRGKCEVKTGTFDNLRPMAEALIDRGINATIE